MKRIVIFASVPVIQGCFVFRDSLETCYWHKCACFITFIFSLSRTTLTYTVLEMKHTRGYVEDWDMLTSVS